MFTRFFLAAALAFLVAATLSANIWHKDYSVLNQPVRATAISPPSSRDANDSAADAAAIRANIESIFQAFIDGDTDKIYATHSSDWRGFLEGSHAPIKGVDDYMRANGFEWPRPAGAPKKFHYYPPGTTYKVSDFDVNFYGPELAVACLFGDFQNKQGDAMVTMRRFRIMDVYAKRDGSWIQVASNTAVDPEWRAQQESQAISLNPQVRQYILKTRESVWRAYFANDRATLERMIPDGTIAINNGSEEWSNREAILAGAKDFADHGGRLLKLEFPKTEIQVYGNTIILYTTYAYETEIGGKRVTESGRGTEIFIRRGDDLLNVGWHLDSGK
jgi:Domain of unknown function (DUF4440)